MKRQFFYSLFLLSAASLLAGTGFAQSGWIRQHSPFQGPDTSFLGVSFVDARTGFIVGGYGTILHTTDGGATWTSQVSGTLHWLFGVSATDTSTATAVGDSGTILRTTNGGAIWTQQTSGTVHALEAACFTNATTGTAVGDSGTVLRTTDGGATWTSQVSGTFSNLNAVSFLDQATGTVVGNAGAILHTTDGGALWSSHSISPEYRLLGVALTSADTGVVVADKTCFLTPCSDNGPNILRIANGGILWQAVPPDRLFGSCKGCYPDYLGAVSFPNSTMGTVAVRNCIFHTTNGGGVVFTDSAKAGQGSWSVQVADSNVYQALSFTDANNGTAVGERGVILHTTSGGVTGIKENHTPPPSRFLLEQNYPNPFNPGTIISYELPVSSLVTIKIYDALGREVQTLVNERQRGGRHSLTFRAGNLASGAYYYRIQAEKYSAAKKLLLLR